MPPYHRCGAEPRGGHSPQRYHMHMIELQKSVKPEAAQNASDARREIPEELSVAGRTLP
jgi:hypothetical protein